MKLYRPLPDVIEYKGRRYRLRLSFDRVLAALDVLEDGATPPDVRNEAAVSLLIKGRKKPDGGALEAIFKMLSGEKTTRSATKTMDFSQDAAYIYAGFRQAYGIDLLQERGRLHWMQFSALLQALPDDTRMMQIVSIRTRPIPKPTKYNADERAALMKAKQEYALRGSDTAADCAESAGRLFDALSAIAKR